MSDQMLQQIDELLARRLGTMEESINGKLELLAEGQQTIVERMDRFEVRLDSVERIVTEHSGQLAGLAVDLQATNARIDGVEQNLSAKIDAVAVDLSAHRHDTEAHGRGYLVSE